MKKTLVVLAIVFMSLTAQASNSDLYFCQGPGIKLEMLLDWFGKGFTQTIKGTIQGKAIAFSPDLNFDHPRKLDPGYQFIFYKDPKSDLMIKMYSPSEESLPDFSYSGYVILGGKEIRIECLNPTYR